MSDVQAGAVADSLRQIIAAATQNPLNQAFALVIMGLAGVALLGALVQRGMLGRVAQTAPGTLTALGVLGTFVGILFGLLAFDVDNISASVPRLLDGMKTAFVTSVLGIGAGIAIRFVNDIAARGTAARQGQGVEDVIAVLGRIDSGMARSRDDIVASVERARAALSGDSESSLVTQLQRLRTDVTDEIKASRTSTDARMAAIGEEIRNISKTLAEDTTETFVKALEAAIKDFNQRITEQFGENFKQLNVAVGRLLEWQESYRAQMIANAAALQDGAAGVTAARISLDAIAAQSEAMVHSATAMQALIGGIEETRVELERRLAAFSAMATQAGEAMPVIQRGIDALTTGFAAEVQKATALAQEAGQSLRNTAVDVTQQVGAAMLQATESAAALQASQAEGYKGLAQGYERLRADAATAHESIRTEIANTATASQKAATETVRSVSEALQRTTNEAFSSIAGSLDGQIKQLDAALQSELTKALAQLGSQLASLSSQFVNDYGPLTQQLREVVQIARRVQ